MDYRLEKVEIIFHKFDANQDGCLNREEMKALVTAVNPRVKFTNQQMKVILDEVFKIYKQFINDEEKGLTLDGLLRSYKDGAGDINRDFDALGLELNPTPVAEDQAIESNDTWTLAEDQAIEFNDTWTLTEDRAIKFNDTWTLTEDRAPEISEKRVLWEELDDNYAAFVKQWGVLRLRADATSSKEEAFDRHMAMAKVLYDNHLYIEAFISFQRACELQPTHIIPWFRLGCCLYQLGRHEEAKGEFFQALKAAMAGVRSSDYYLLPQIHVNLGIVFQQEGMFLTACDHYREASILCPTHFRAWKLLGGALLLVGEYKAAVMALEIALFLKSDLEDEHCYMVSALLAMGDQDKAIVYLEKAIDLNPHNVDALFNLGEVYMDKGSYHRACVGFTSVLNVSPNHWKAQLGRVVSLFGTGETEEAMKALKEALKIANRVELHDRIVYLKQLQKMWKGNGNGAWEEANYIIVESSKFKRTDESTTLRLELANALAIRHFQKISGMNRCDVELLKKQMSENYIPMSYFDCSLPEKCVSKGSVEGILCRLLSFLGPKPLVEAIKAINQKILCVLDESKSSRIDLGLFYALVAPLCKGPLDKRKRVAYYALLRQPGNEGSSKLRKTDAQSYIKLLRTVYNIPSDGANEMLEMNGETDTSMVSLTGFLAMFDDPDCGFGVMSTLLKLETGNRNGSYVCATCGYAIIGSRFKEIKSHFSLCSHCYSEGKVPSACQQEEYIFREYANRS
ncbi:hypothetical protein ACH5RR_026832 [Cinchona calisaya]|uniref:EF-hand domain-containing protein n=1 Tax=Cinchona calisaya TaxID=153742 RepID=A0ABD2Z3Q6_9GENT